MNNLIKHPISITFQEKYKPEDEHVLNEILNKIKNNKFKNIQEWIKSVNLVWEYTIKTYEDDIDSINSAIYLKKLFNKEILKFFYNNEQWCQKIDKYREKITFLINSPPTDILFKNFGIDLEQKICPQLQTDKEIKNLIEAISMIENLDYSEQIISFIFNLQPELNTDKNKIELNILQLKPQTIKELIKKLKENFPKKGLIYPT